MCKWPRPAIKAPLFWRLPLGVTLRAVPLAALLTLLLMCQGAVAQTDWNLNSGGDWNTAINWNPATVPNATDVAVDFPAGFPGAGSTINVSSGVTVGSISLNDNTTSFITGSDINLNVSAGSASITFVTGAWTISNNLVLNDSFQVTTTVAGTLNGTISGSQTLTKLGSATLTIGGTNTYTGATTISAGTLQLGAAGVIADASAVSIGGSGTLDLNDFNETVGSLAGNAGAKVTLGSAVLSAGSDNTSTAFAGVLSETGGLTKLGSGTLSLSGTNTYTGATTVNGGTLQLGAAGVIADASAISIGASGTLDLNDFNETVGSLAGAAGGKVTLGSAQLSAGGDDTSTTFAGVLSETGGLTKLGNGTLTLSGVNTFTGVLNMDGGVTSAGADNNLGAGSLAFDGGTLQLSASFNSAKNVLLNAGDGTIDTNGFNSTFSGIISDGGGVNSLTKSGAGTLTLSGANTYTGATTISAGRLAVNGSLTSAVTVNNTAFLGGNGTITGDVTVNNGGTLAAGNSIGTLNIVGDYTQNVGSTMQVEIQAATNPTTAGVDNDLVDVTGNVTLNGGTVDVQAAAGAYTAYTEYTFLQHTGALTGTFDTITDNLAFLDATLNYNAGDISFTLLPAGNTFASVALTPNQHAVGTYLDDISGAATGDLQTVINQLLLLTNSGAQNAYDQLSGDLHGSVSQIGIERTTLMYRMLNNRTLPGMFGDADSQVAVVRPVETPTIQLVSYQDGQPLEIVIHDPSDYYSVWGGWALGYGMGGQLKGGASIDYSVVGTLFGVERYLDSQTLFGIFGGYSGANINNNFIQSADANSYLGGGYLRTENDICYRVISGSLGYDSYDTLRNVRFGVINRAALSSHDGWQGSAYIEQGLTYADQCCSFQPYAALQYAYQRQHGFTETGAGAFNLAVSGIDTQSLRSVLGARAAWRLPTCPCRTIIPSVRVAWMHEFFDSSTLVSSRFTSAGGGFTVGGANLGRDWALLGGGLNWNFNDALGLYADYDLQANGRQVSHVGSGGLQLQW